MRRALEDMGPTFVKLGQILSTRVDLFAPEWIAEFERLQDHASAAPFDAIRTQLASSLRRELDLRTECRNAERIAANLSANENIVVPRIYWQWATQRLNVQAYVDGIPGSTWCRKRCYFFNESRASGDLPPP